MKTFKIGTKPVGNNKTFIIAEAGVNHNGNLDTAGEMVKRAARCGADAIKFQSFRADYMCVKTLQETKSVEGITGGTKSSYDMYKSLELSEEAHLALKSEADSAGIILISSVFDEPMVDFLKSIHLPAIKISSGDITYKALIEKAARSKLPLILSTGMAKMEEITKAVRWAKAAGCRKIALLHCVAVYPPRWEDLHLRFIPSLKKKFNCPVGFSDHTPVAESSIAAVALGADILEKHFTLDKNMPGPDHKLSLDPMEFTDMVDKIRIIEMSL
ncbi:MAG: N-acetylneuraminate synthase family protein, partial [Candidatus Aureabacteria bacterium]|nr:N-acetylneuraminate synthase family protein [Candidatus Auribacterota bacterium]